MSRINALEVRLAVGDVARSVAFYATTLGFAFETVWSAEAPQFAVLHREGVRLQLSRQEQASAPACMLWLDVTALDVLQSTVTQQVPMEWGPAVYWYGRRECAFRDPDGYLIILSEVTDASPTCGEG